jgi:hypothetical protein
MARFDILELLSGELSSVGALEFVQTLSDGLLANMHDSDYLPDGSVETMKACGYQDGGTAKPVRSATHLEPSSVH